MFQLRGRAAVARGAGSRQQALDFTPRQSRIHIEAINLFSSRCTSYKKTLDISYSVIVNYNSDSLPSQIHLIAHRASSPSDFWTQRKNTDFEGESNEISSFFALRDPAVVLGNALGNVPGEGLCPVRRAEVVRHTQNPGGHLARPSHDRSADGRHAKRSVGASLIARNLPRK